MMRFSGAIFDVDGVLLDTPHEQAWREAFAQLIAGPWRDIAPQTSYTSDGYTPAVYQCVVAGKPRDDGAKAALAYFHVPDPNGERAREYEVLKQRILEDLARKGDFHAFDDALRFVLKLKDAGVRIATASSSKNASMFMQAIAVGEFCAQSGLQYSFVLSQSTLRDIVDVDVSGWNIVHGKPNPEIFLTAAAQLRYPPEHCFVVEDAAVGIQAAKAGGMVGIGVARLNDAALLHAAAADLVVTSLDAVDVSQLLGSFSLTSLKTPLVAV